MTTLIPDHRTPGAPSSAPVRSSASARQTGSCTPTRWPGSVREAPRADEEADRFDTAGHRPLVEEAELVDQVMTGPCWPEPGRRGEGRDGSFGRAAGGTRRTTGWNRPRVIERVRTGAEEHAELAALTEQERKIPPLIAEGLMNRQIGSGWRRRL